MPKSQLCNWVQTILLFLQGRTGLGSQNSILRHWPANWCYKDRKTIPCLPRHSGPIWLESGTFLFPAAWRPPLAFFTRTHVFCPACPPPHWIAARANGLRSWDALPSWSEDMAVLQERPLLPGLDSCLTAANPTNWDKATPRKPSKGVVKSEQWWAKQWQEIVS